MKILMTIHHRLERNAGAAGVTLSLAEQFRKLGHETAIVSFDDLPNRLTEKVHRLLFPYLVAARMARERNRWDVLDASSGDAWICGSLLRRRGRPLIVCRSHGLEHVAHERLLEEVGIGAQKLSWKYPIYHGGLRLWEARKSLQDSDLVLLLNSEDCRYAVEKLRVPRRKIRIVQNGIPERFLEQALRSVNFCNSDPLVIAQIGRYSWMKGVAYGSQALNNILRRYQHVQVHFMGTMVEAESVLRDFHPDVRDRIVVTPRFAHETLPTLLANCQVKFFPTLSEGFGLALIEAMACGLAPVTTAAPGPSMIVVHRQNGLIVPPADSNALEQALESLILDPDLLSRLRQRAFADAEAYSWAKVAERQVALFQEFRGVLE